MKTLDQEEIARARELAVDMEPTEVHVPFRAPKHIPVPYEPPPYPAHIPFLYFMSMVAVVLVLTGMF